MSLRLECGYCNYRFNITHPSLGRNPDDVRLLSLVVVTQTRCPDCSCLIGVTPAFEADIIVKLAPVAEPPEPRQMRQPDRLEWMRHSTQDAGGNVIEFNPHRRRRDDE